MEVDGIYSCPFYDRLPLGDRSKRLFDELRAKGIEPPDAYELTMGLLKKEKIENKPIPQNTRHGSWL